MTKLRKTKIYCRHNENGFALVAVLGMGIFAIAVMFGLFPLVMNATKNESGMRYISELRAAADTGVDYAISQLNQSASAQLPCPIDPGAALKNVSVMPVQYLANPNINVQIQVRRLSDMDWQQVRSFSCLYSAQLDPANATSSDYNSPIRTTVTKDYWRIVEVTARRGMFGRSVRVILEPRFDAPLLGGGPSPTGYSPYFNSGLFANSSLVSNPANGSLVITGGDPTGGAYPLTLQTNQQATIGSGTNLFGNLQVTNNAKGASTPVAVGPGVDGQTEIHGLLTLNSSGSNSSQGFHDTPGNAPANTGVDNVLADAEIATGASARSAPNDVPITTDAGLDQFGMAPTQANSSAVQLPDLGALAAANQSLGAGSYETGSLSTAGFSEPVNLGAGSTNIYIVDGSSQSAAVDISSSNFVNSGSATNLQIWYSGTRPVNLELSSGKNFNGIIYAPNATVSVSGDGGFNGAINANKVSMSNTTGTPSLPMRILTNLANVNGGQSSANPAFAVAKNGSREPLLQGYRAVTWQESNTSFVGP